MRLFECFQQTVGRLRRHGLGWDDECNPNPALMGGLSQICAQLADRLDRDLGLAIFRFDDGQVRVGPGLEQQAIGTLSASAVILRWAPAEHARSDAPRQESFAHAGRPCQQVGVSQSIAATCFAELRPERHQPRENGIRFRRHGGDRFHQGVCWARKSSRWRLSSRWTASTAPLASMMR